MKKIISVLTCLIAFVSMAVAQDYDNATKVKNDTPNQRIIVPDGFKTFYDKRAEDVLKWEIYDADGKVTDSGTDGKYKYMSKELVDGGGTIEIVYEPLSDSIRLYYTCLYSSYDRGKAMNDVISVVQNFEILKVFENENGELMEKPRYYEYTYYAGNDKFGHDSTEKGFKKGKVKYMQYYVHLKFKK